MTTAGHIGQDYVSTGMGAGDKLINQDEEKEPLITPGKILAL